MVAFCVQKRIHPDVLTVGGLGLSFAAGGALWLAGSNVNWLWLVPPCVLLRLVLNLLDGQVARAQGLADAWGEVKNEFGDRDELIQRSMQLIHDTLPPDGVFIFTTQVNHPQLKLIAALPNRDGQPWIMKNRSVPLVEGWARAAGFSNVKTTLEPHGLFSVSVAMI